MVTTLLNALVDELVENDIAEPLGEPFTLAALWADLARLAGEPLPADVAALLDAPRPARTLRLVPPPRRDRTPFDDAS